jgi:hypothetical protein
MSKPVVGAFFDFDKTLLETESAKLGLKYLWDRRLLSMTIPRQTPAGIRRRRPAVLSG